MKTSKRLLYPRCRYCFRLHKNIVYYVSTSLVKRATNIKWENLVAFGTNIGKFTKSGKFHLTIQALNLLAANAKHKAWLKPTSDMSFLYGNDVIKGALGRITDNINAYDGVVVFSMSDVPLGLLRNRLRIAGRWTRMGL